MKITLYGKTFNSDFESYILEFFNNLQKHKVDVTVYKPFYDFLKKTIKYDFNINNVFENLNDFPDDTDFMISIGGDGTFLEAITFLKNFNIPIVGLNSGRLGFLANISKEEINLAFDAIFNNQYDFEYRSIIKVETGKKLFNGLNYALNEVAIQKMNTDMITIDVFLNNEYVNSYWTDGLIVSTPTGSTAYSLSVGGPIAIPGSENFIIAPIASHNLTVRPLVVPDNNKISIKVNCRCSQFYISVDNRTELV